MIFQCYLFVLIWQLLKLIISNCIPECQASNFCIVPSNICIALSNLTVRLHPWEEFWCVSVNSETYQSWCHDILVTAPEIWEGNFWWYQLIQRRNKAWYHEMSWHQKYARGDPGDLTSICLLGVLMFMLQSDATTSWSQHQKYERETSMSLCLYLDS